MFYTSVKPCLFEIDKYQSDLCCLVNYCNGTEAYLIVLDNSNIFQNESSNILEV